MTHTQVDERYGKLKLVRKYDAALKCWTGVTGLCDTQAHLNTKTR